MFQSWRDQLAAAHSECTQLKAQVVMADTVVRKQQQQLCDERQEAKAATEATERQLVEVMQSWTRALTLSLRPCTCTQVTKKAEEAGREITRVKEKVGTGEIGA